MPELTPTGSLHLSAYNPRHTDPARLDLIELSLRKLGFVFPIYATVAGEILSGHQRHIVASRMGLAEVPVERVPKVLDLDARKCVNVLFNRATNELTACTSTQRRRDELAAGALDDVADLFPCLAVRDVPTSDLIAMLGDARNEYGTSISRTLWQRARVAMPVLVDPRGRVLNGVGRLRFYARARFATTPVVVVPEQRAQVCALLVNKVSMDFDIDERYADLLRYNSYRQNEWRKGLGKGFVTELTKSSGTAKSFDIEDRRDRRRWIGEYGDRVVDFGAGRLVETGMLRAAGVDVAAFEPYVHADADGGVSRAATVAVVEAFLAHIAAGLPYSTVFCSSVLNSVPFRSDRDHVARILAALAWPAGRAIATARSTASTSWSNLNGREYLNTNAGNSTFALDYEPGIGLGGFHNGKPKIQKFHTSTEFYELFAPYFGHVNVRDMGHNVVARCREALEPDAAGLADSLAFEFDLPLPDGGRLGLADAAITAFTERIRRVRESRD